MRLNKFISQNSSLSRRAADEAISSGRVRINGAVARLGQPTEAVDEIRLDGTVVTPVDKQYIILNKPKGYVCSRAAQSEAVQTIYELLPEHLRSLKTAGRLDADSRGLIVLTSDGDYAHQLMHPSFQKNKTYHVRLESMLQPDDQAAIEQGIMLNDGKSQLDLLGEGKSWRITMHEGRNRQIRRTFGTLGYTILDLQRTALGSLELGDLPEGEYRAFTPDEKAFSKSN